KSSEANPPLFYPVYSRWENPGPDPDRLIPEDASSDSSTEALTR
ncbi:hypothetical protein LINGRAHAP2_LOCUS7278, partial [Linum grandiflorum]